MPNNDSIHHKPRVHIKYEVETEHGIEEKELPFVIGVIGNFSGRDSQDKKSLKHREFLTINPNNFDSILTELQPKLAFKVENKLNSSKGQLAINLHFKKMQDFKPDQLIEQIEPLRKLKQARDKLRELLNKTECSENLEQIISQYLQEFPDLKTKAVTTILENTQYED